MHSGVSSEIIFPMALIAGRERRSPSGAHELLQGRVRPEVKERARRGAAVRGISLALYLEQLVEADELADTYVAPEPAEQLDLKVAG